MTPREFGYTQYTLPYGLTTECTMCGDRVTEGIVNVHVKDDEYDRATPVVCLPCYEDVRASETSVELQARFALRGKTLRERK